jgi:hypothetical protein
MTLAAAMVRNPEWLEMLKSAPGGPGGAPQAVSRSGRRFNPTEKAWHHSAALIVAHPPASLLQSTSSSCCPSSRAIRGQRSRGAGNAMSSFRGAAPAARRRRRASWLPLHPPAPQGSKKRYGCLAPLTAPTQRAATACRTRSSRGLLRMPRSRRRRIPLELL